MAVLGVLVMAVGLLADPVLWGVALLAGLAMKRWGEVVFLAVVLGTILHVVVVEIDPLPTETGTFVAVLMARLIAVVGLALAVFGVKRRRAARKRRW